MNLARQMLRNQLMPLNDESFFPWDLSRSSESSQAHWSPRIDVYESGDNLVFEVELPGIHRDDVNVSMEDNRLTIEGTRRESKDVEEEDRDYHRSERYYGRFQRTFTLPETVDAEKIEARYEDGVLTVALPKSARARKQRITVE